ncbi:DUF2760 domain-containing protein [bacterium]|nr:DUF2760 domain-containing protein [bacterium]
MKLPVKIAAVLLILLSAALFVPAASAYLPLIAAASLLVAVALLIATLTDSHPVAVAVPQPAVAEAVKPAALPAVPKNQVQAEVITLLGVLQDKGRLVDFLMDDITPYNDEQVGSVVRAVHQGCKAALMEHFTIEPVATENEGADITVPAGYAADEFRLVGNLAGEAPFTGKLVHKGWKVKSMKLPRVLQLDENRLPAIAPAEVEIS